MSGRFHSGRFASSRFNSGKFSGSGEYVPPPFVVYLTGLTNGVANVGDTIGYGVAWNDPEVTIIGQQWRSDGVDIAGATGLTLDVTEAMSETVISVVSMTAEYGARSSFGVNVARNDALQFDGQNMTWNSEMIVWTAAA